jgi:hypothetical protein
VEAINKWRREKLSDQERTRYAHPTTVWRKYQADITKANKTVLDDISAGPSTKEELAMAEAQIRELERG